MKPFQANLLASAILILFGLWAYFNMAAESRSMTVLIPVMFGFALMALTPQLKRENKLMSYLVVVLTALITLALIMPLIGSLNRQDPMAVFRVGAMMLACIFAIVVYIKSFIAQRQQS